MAGGQTGGGSSGIADGSIVNGAGGDANVLADITGGVATLRSMKAGTNMTITEEEGDILFDASGGGSGLTQGEINQLFAATPSVLCSNTPVNAGSITATVAVSGGNATLTCSADCSAYIKPYSVVGTAAQSGKGALVVSVSADGLTITCQGIGEDNPLSTDAVSSQLKLYGAPFALLGNPTGGVRSVLYATDEGTVHIDGHGYWTGPLFNAGKWFSAGNLSGYVINGGTFSFIKAITSHALVLAPLTDSGWKTVTLPNNTADQVILTIAAGTYISGKFEIIAVENGTTNISQWDFLELFYDTTHKIGEGVFPTNPLTNGDPGVTLSDDFSSTTYRVKATSTNTGNDRTIYYRTYDLVTR